MSSACAQPSARARKVVQVILQRVAGVKNQAVGDAIGKDESTVSRIVSGEIGVKLELLEPFLTSLALKIVDANRICIDVEKYNAMLILAKRAIAQEQKIEGPQLEWEEPLK